MRHNIIKKTLICGAVLFATMAGCSLVCADDLVDFEGNDSHGSSAKCSTFNHGLIYACGSPAGSEGGGASWHIYKVGSGNYPLYSSAVLGNGGADLNTILSTCAEYGYFAAYGWEGHSTKNFSGNGSDLGVLWGPAAYGKGLIAEAEYNKANTTGTIWNNLSKESLKGYAKALKEGSAGNNIKLGPGGAEALRQEIKANANVDIDFSVGAFCVNPDWFENAIYARSFVGVTTSQGGSDLKDTGVTNTPQPTTVTTTTMKIKEKESAEIRFSHNVYSDAVNETVYWEVKRDGFSGSGFRIVSSDNGSGGVTGVRTATFTEGERSDGHYIGGPRSYSDGKNYFIWRDTYNIIFNDEGTYQFCEDLYARGKNGDKMLDLTRVCTVVQVGTGGPDTTETPPGSCGAFATMQNGVTQVISKVINQGNNERKLTRTYSGWQDQVYAMPTDVIAWRDCYLPGAQVYASKIVSKFYNNGTTVTSTPALSDAKVAAGRGTYDEDEGTYENAAEPSASQLREVPEDGDDDSPTGTISRDSSAAWDGHAAEGVCRSTTNAEKIMYNVYAETFGHSWTNKYKAVTTAPYGFNELNLSNRTAPKNFPSNTEWQSYGVGESTVRSKEHNYVIARSDDVSRTYSDVVTTQGTPITSSWSNDGKGYHPWTCCSCTNCGLCCCSESGCSCCCCCTYSHTNLYNIGSASDNINASDASHVTVPYNYYNTTEHTVASTSGSVVYAGETIWVSNTKAIVNERQNDVVEAKYTTQVDNAEVQLIGYVTTTDHVNDASFTRYGDHNSNICAWLPQKQCALEQKTGTTILNAIGDIHGHTDYMSWDSRNYNVFDASAGDYMCFVMAVYPASSGPEHLFQWDTITNPVGDGQWRVSAPQCIKIAKRPSLQILGGDLYSGGGISASVSQKKQLLNVGNYNYPAYPNPTDRSGLVVNGSWVEEGLVARGAVKEFSSGASLGGVAGDSRISGGLNATKLCATRAPLSFANYSSFAIGNIICPNTQAVGYSAIASTIKNREALADYWGVDGDASTTIYLTSGNEGNVDSATGKNIRVYSSTNDVEVAGGSIGADTMRAVRTSKNVVISANIYYNSGTITSAGQVPKVIIYGRNIEIECQVGRIDAILIAEEKITTCRGYTGGSNLDAAARSNQLIINGIVIANSMDAGRTFGNSVGNGSGVAAEVINYDTSTLLWGRYMAGSAESDTMTVTYQHELAPRY